MHLAKEFPAAPAFALFELGFRPFFAAAGLFSIVATGVWMLAYAHAVDWVRADISGVHWHAHEMIFGYSMAVIAGFLLTAVGNWTGMPGLGGKPLMGLLAVWLVARAAYFLPTSTALMVSALADCAFMVGLLFAIGRPVVKVKQWNQLWVLALLLALLLSNLLFHAGLQGYLAHGIRWGLYLGLYVVVALIFAMARRVLPFFIERGVAEDFHPRNRRWIDIGGMILLVAWIVTDVFRPQAPWMPWLSATLVVLHGIRLRDWFTPRILRAPLLWSLFAGYGFLVLGFLLKGLSVWPGISPMLSLHAFSFGGIGLITLSMMSRVTLGHTGRSVLDPPRSVVFLFTVIIVGGVTRVIIPIVDGSHYASWIVVSQALWVLAFVGFLIVFSPMLFRPRVDGRRG